jgi:hypothetical protein
MRNRTYICKYCGEVKRCTDEGRDAVSSRRHCDFPLEPLSHEQGYAATHLAKEDRPSWYSKGAHILKGPSKRKRWIAAVKEQKIEEAKRQKAAFKPKQRVDILHRFSALYDRFFGYAKEE